MKHSKRKMLAATAAILVAAAGCGHTSSSSSGSGGSGSSGGGKSITVGLLVDQSGLAAPNNEGAVQGVEAGLHRATAEGYNIKYVTADTQSSPSGALAAAQKLVDQDRVSVVLAQSSLTFSAAPWLTAHKIPVIGIAEDGPEWISSKNMFAITGALHNDKAATTFGKIYKLLGGTNIGSLGYGISPISADEAKTTVTSAKAAGLKAGYLNANFAFGSTNVEPVALAMKSAGIDSLAATVNSTTAFALITALRQGGVDLKAPLLSTGYGNDLTAAGPGASHVAQNVYFTVGFEPMEMQTAATKQFQADLTATGYKGEPGYAVYDGYVDVALLTDALAKTSGTSSGDLQTALTNDTSFNAWGLWGGRTLNPNDRTTTIVGVDNCLWVTKYSGSTFHLVTGADPMCGTAIPGNAS